MKKIALIFFTVLLLTACSNLESSGFDQNGIHKVTKTKYNEKGYDVNGFDKSGYDKDGIDKAGYNKSGYDSEGYNREGYNKKGYNIKGYDKKGYDEDGYNKNGINKSGKKRDVENNEESNKTERVPVKQVYKYGDDTDTRTIPLEEKNNLQRIINDAGKIEKGKIEYLCYQPYKNKDGNIIFQIFVRNGMDTRIYNLHTYIEIYYKNEIMVAGTFNLSNLGSIPSNVSVISNLAFRPDTIIREDLVEELLENVKKKRELENKKQNVKGIDTYVDLKYNFNYMH